MGDRTPAAGPARLTERDLAAIEERAEAATPGPWTPSIDTTGRAMVVVDIAPHQFREVIVADDDGPREEDLDFVAHARSDVPALLAALRAAWAERGAEQRWSRQQATAIESCRLRIAALEAEAARYRAALEDVIAQVEAAEHTSMWMEARAAIKRARAALAAPGAGEEREA